MKIQVFSGLAMLEQMLFVLPMMDSENALAQWSLQISKTWGAMDVTLRKQNAKWNFQQGFEVAKGSQMKSRWW